LKTDWVARTASADWPLAALYNPEGSERQVKHPRVASKAALISSKIKFTIFLAAL